MIPEALRPYMGGLEVIEPDRANSTADRMIGTATRISAVAIHAIVALAEYFLSNLCAVISPNVRERRVTELRRRPFLDNSGG